MIKGKNNLYLIRNLDGLFKKINKRLPYHDFIELATKSHAKADKKEFAFNHFRYYKFLLSDLIDEYLKRNFINRGQYYSIKIFIFLNTVKFYMSFIFKTRKYYRLDQSLNIQNYKYLTLTLGSKRLVPSGFDNIKDIEAPYRVYKFSIIEKISIIFNSIKKGVPPHLEAQYFILKKDIQYFDLSNSIIVIEECMDVEKQIFCDVIQEKCQELIITQRGIPYLPLYFYNVNVNVNNNISHTIQSKVNKKVSYEYNYPIGLNENIIKNKINKDKLRIGYVSDLGDFIISYKDKKEMDLFMKNISISNNYNLIISIHPIELVHKKNFIWYESLTSEKIKIRQENKINDFFNNIDILVGWLSTSLYQALLYKKPVIILDLFNDNHCVDFLNDNNAKGMVKIVKDEKEFNCAVDFFHNLTVDDMNQRYIEAYKILNIKY